MPMGPAKGRLPPAAAMESAFADLLLLFEGFLEKMVIFRENAVFHSKKQRFFDLSRYSAKKGVFLAKIKKNTCFFDFPENALFGTFSKHFEITFFPKPAIY